jgi:hypothetical protein
MIMCDSSCCPADATLSNQPLDPEALTAVLANTDLIALNAPFRVNATLARGSIGVPGVLLTVTGAICVPITPGALTDASGQVVFSCTVVAPAGQKTLTVSAAGCTLTANLAITAYTAALTVSPANPSVTVGGSVSFNTLLSFSPAAALGGYDMTITGSAGVTCTPGMTVTRRDGGATFSCRFDVAGKTQVLGFKRRGLFLQVINQRWFRCCCCDCAVQRLAEGNV